MSDLGPMAQRPTSGGGNLICTSKISLKNEIKNFKNEVILQFRWFCWKTFNKKNDGFLCLVSVSNQNYNNMKKNCTSYLIYRQIWLNLPIDDCHFGCISYFIKKNTWVVPRVFQWCSHTGDCPQKGPQWTKHPPVHHPRDEPQLS